MRRTVSMASAGFHGAPAPRPVTLAALITLATLAGGPPTSSAAKSSAGKAPVAAVPQKSPWVAMALEVRDARARLRDRLAALEAKAAHEADPAAAAALQSEIEQAKVEAEIEVLTIQARHAREGRRVAAATRLDAAIANLRRAAAAQRPQPAPAATRRTAGER